MRLFSITAVFSAALSLLGMSAWADPTQVSISLQTDVYPPASDLSYGGRILSPDQALSLKQSGTDLSLLNPDPTQDQWNGQVNTLDSALDEALPIQAGDTVSFQGVIGSQAGWFRFNVQNGSVKGTPPTLTLMVAETLHTYLLRRELLRRLGYKIEAMKYLPTVQIRFPDLATRDFILTSDMPWINETQASPTRWCHVSQSVLDEMKEELPKGSVPPCVADPSITNSDPLTVTFQDVIATNATPEIQNFALSAPSAKPVNGVIPPESARIARSLAISYGLANVTESINQTDWSVGSVQNGDFNFTVPDQDTFACTKDDALWIARRIQAFTREDFTQMVSAAAFPAPVAMVVVEKLIARRNSILKDLGMQYTAIAYNTEVSDPPSVVSGKVVQEVWPGYASQFAHDDVPSPVQDIGYYLVSQVESNVLNNFIAYANSQIPQISISDDYYKHALSNYMSTGVPQTLQFKPWFAPTLNGGITLSRSIVLGDYLGTKNLVQLADTFGFNLNAGILVGFDGVPTPLNLQGAIQGSISLSVTHLKPLTSLKEAVTEPIHTAFVPWLFLKSSKAVKAMAANKNSTLTVAQVQAALKADMAQLTKNLGVGESLILTESLSGSESITASAQMPGTALVPGVSLTAGPNQLVLRRINILRATNSTVEVFADKGELAGLSLSFSLTADSPVNFPLLTVNASAVAGKGTSDVYSINLDTDTQANPGLYASAAALGTVLRTGSTETLAALQKPLDISIDFRDLSSSFSFLFFSQRYLDSNGDYHITLPSGQSSEFLSLSEGSQSGLNFQSFGQNVGTYIIQKLTGNTNYTINTQVAQNPGQTYHGSSRTRQATFQARLNPGIVQPSVQIQYRWEGWSMNEAKAEKLVSTLNQQYGYTVFNTPILQASNKIDLYDMTVSINMYEAAIDHLFATSDTDLQTFVYQYNTALLCNSPYRNGPPAQYRNACAAISDFVDEFNAYKKGFTDPKKQAAAVLKIFSKLEQFSNFNDITQLIGGTANFYMTGQITGFREGMETQSVPIQANTFGTPPTDNNPTGILNYLENKLGMNDGEFDMEWLRQNL